MHPSDEGHPDLPPEDRHEPDTGYRLSSSAGEVLGRVLAGELSEQDAAAQLDVRRSTLVRWKAQLLTSIEELDGEPDHDRDGHEPADRVGTDVPDSPADLLVPRPHARPAPVEPRLVAAGAIGVVSLGVAFALARPTDLNGLEAFDTLNRWGLYAATLFAVGGVLFLWRVHDDRGSSGERHALTWWTQLAAVVAIATSLIALSVHAAALAGVGPAAMIDHHEVGRAADGAFGISTVMRLLGLTYIVYALRRVAVASSMMVAITGGVLTLGSFLLIGHTATGQPRAVVVTGDLVHTLAAAGWFGGLVLLSIAVRHRRATGDTAGAATMVGRFSTFAAVSVTALFASGTAMAATELPSWGDLLTHDYGVTILVKVALVLAVLAAAAYNLRRLVPHLREHHADAPEAWRRLRLTLVFETSVLVVVLLVTALLVNLPSPS